MKPTEQAAKSGPKGQGSPEKAASPTEEANPTTDTSEAAKEPDPNAASDAVAVAEPPPPPPASAPPAKQVKRDPLALFNPVRDRVVALMNEEWFQREASFAMQVINENDALRTTDMQSRVQCMLNLANTGLTLNPVMRIAYLVPRKGKCKLEPSYIGLIKGVTDSGSVKLIRANIVYEGDEFEMELGTTVKVHHKPYWLKKGVVPGEILGAYSVAVLHDGTTDVLDMGRDVLDRIKEANESVKKGKFSPYTDWGSEMFRKAPVRRHIKTLPRTDRKEYERLMHMIALDEEPFGSKTAAAHQGAAEDKELRGVQLRIAAALDDYRGDDREELRAQIRAKIEANEFTIDYGERMLAEITGQGG